MFMLLMVNVISGLLLAAISVPLLLEKIPRNHIYGFRVKATFKDKKTWFAVNKFAAKRLLATGLGFTAAALGLYFVPGLSVDAYALVCLAVFVVFFGVSIYQSFRFIRRLEKNAS